MNEETVQASMEIIMHAGNARLACTKALAAAANSQLAQAQEFHAQAKKDISSAHHIQTDVIQAEMGGGAHLEYSSLFAHAQDTLMTVYSEINMTKQLLTVFENYEKRFEALSERINALEAK